MDDNDIAMRALFDFLQEDDRHTISYRVQRLKLLVSEYGEEDTVRMFPGGLVTARAFEEARLAYLHGLFLSCVILCQTCVEHALAAIFRMAGHDELDRSSFHTLLIEAQKKQFISDEEFGLFDRLRELRNPYVHSRAPSDRTSVLKRSISVDTPFEEFLAEDAEYAITSLLRLFTRYPFAL